MTYVQGAISRINNKGEECSKDSDVSSFFVPTVDATRIVEGLIQETLTNNKDAVRLVVDLSLPVRE